jgi:hypothetical protein
MMRLAFSVLTTAIVLRIRNIISIPCKTKVPEYINIYDLSLADKKCPGVPSLTDVFSGSNRLYSTKASPENRILARRGWHSLPIEKSTSSISE